MSNAKKSGGQIQASLAVLVLIISTSLFFIPILILGLLKLIPIVSWQVNCTRMIDSIIVYWCALNSAYIDWTQKDIKWTVTGVNNLDIKGWYLVVANHQSWLDIVLLQRLFDRKIPMLKFFIKDQLKWVPLLGFAWWAMGCPFMKRYSKEYLAQNPGKKGKDLDATRKALELFKRTPSTVMSFIEGTRFTDEKHRDQQSPYQYLLKPRAGGISFVISALGDKIQHLLDVTIIYAEKEHSLWDFLCGRLTAISMHVREIPVPKEFTYADALENEDTQNAFRDWLNEQWREKDALISRERAKGGYL
ncbi:acyltransferase [Legionella sp. CNM-4043-24]|uniref:acyltransferase n=1 Tax=Legionella sp. CNM-4043-24 TaxID=3421646 RepID=UPI00403B310A